MEDDTVSREEQYEYLKDETYSIYKVYNASSDTSINSGPDPCGHKRTYTRTLDIEDVVLC